MCRERFTITKVKAKSIFNTCQHRIFFYRVRDEIRMTIAAYQTLYESSVAFGMRKSLMSEQGKVDMEENIGQLQQDKRELEQQVYHTVMIVLSSCTAGNGIKK